MDEDHTCRDIFVTKVKDKSGRRAEAEREESSDRAEGEDEGGDGEGGEEGAGQGVAEGKGQPGARAEEDAALRGVDAEGVEEEGGEERRGRRLPVRGRQRGRVGQRRQQVVALERVPRGSGEEQARVPLHPRDVLSCKPRPSPQKANLHHHDWLFHAAIQKQKVIVIHSRICHLSHLNKSRCFFLFFSFLFFSLHNKYLAQLEISL